jgi:mono/diheme cytochrome c family protein
VRQRSPLALLAIALVVAGSAPVRLSGQRGQQPAPGAAGASVAAHQAFLDQYCITCHNQKLKTPASDPLFLDALSLAAVGNGAEPWEAVVKKLRTGAMPPATAPQPPAGQADALASWLEGELDRAAAAQPNPGRVPAFHRLTRTEYRNAVRDLLALDNLPKELDIELLLPADNAVGFDTVAETLFVTPTQMEGYLTAARKLSAVAMGDPAIPLIVDIYRPGLELPQDDHVAELPIGTRGGLAIPRYFPVDAEYVIKIDVSGAGREPHQLEVSIDGERVKIFTTGPPMAARTQSPDDADDDSGLQVRVPVRAGPRVVGVTFVKRTSAYVESLTTPFRRGRGPQPAVSAVTISGPYGASAAPSTRTRSRVETPSRRRVLVCQPENAGAEEPCAGRIISTLARRAFRRASGAYDVAALLPFYREGRKEGSFETGIQRVVERVLVSPEFLFRIEDTPPGAARTTHRISDVELASRLSFFIWSSIPDDELLDAAIAGRLRQPQILERQVRRLLADTRAEALVTNFAAQWLYLRDLAARRPNDRFFPDFDEGLRQALSRETELFMSAIVREDRPAVEMLSANYTFVNQRLAQHYGIPNVYGSDFRRITLPGASPRGGLLGQGSILTLTSYSTRTSPVVRGKWILENIVGMAPPPPPPEVPALKDEPERGKPLPMRERMVEHRANPTCASCHARMDPLGFALENFDAIGRWRDRSESGGAIDASGRLPDGTAFEGVSGLRQVLLARPDRFVTTLTEKLLVYALGRELGYYDAPAVRAIVREAASHDYRFGTLVAAIARSRPFQMRRSEVW